MGLLHKLEKELIERMVVGLSVDSHFDSDTLTFITLTSYDGIEINRTEIDMEPMVEAVVKRIMRD